MKWEIIVYVLQGCLICLMKSSLDECKPHWVPATHNNLLGWCARVNCTSHCPLSRVKRPRHFFCSTGDFPIAMLPKQSDAQPLTRLSAQLFLYHTLLLKWIDSLLSAFIIYFTSLLYHSVVILRMFSFVNGFFCHCDDHLANLNHRLLQVYCLKNGIGSVTLNCIEMS